MRERLAAPRSRPRAARPGRRRGTDEPAVALLDAWAVVADAVSFYSERIANEGFLRTATSARRVRELARTLGYELRPGVAAQVDLAFTVETAPGAPEVDHRPGRDAGAVRARSRASCPQTFETAADLEVRAGLERASPRSTPDRRRSRRIDESSGSADRSPSDRATPSSSPSRPLASGHAGVPGPATSCARSRTRTPPPTRAGPGWTSTSRSSPLTTPRHVPAHRRRGARVPRTAAAVRLERTGPEPARRARPDPPGRGRMSTRTTPLEYIWTNYGVTDPLEVDGDHPAILPDTGWSSPSRTRGGLPRGRRRPRRRRRFAVSGPVTRVDVDAAGGPGGVRPPPGRRARRLDAAARRPTSRTTDLHRRDDARPAGDRPAAAARPAPGARREECPSASPTGSTTRPRTSPRP